MIVVVTGGRHFQDKDLVFKTLDSYQPHIVVHGDATGADYFAKQWALQNNVTQYCYPADWNTYGKFAGPIRNRTMFERHQVDIVLAFEGGAGTKDCCEQAGHFKVKVEKITSNENSIATRLKALLAPYEGKILSKEVKEEIKQILNKFLGQLTI